MHVFQGPDGQYYVVPADPTDSPIISNNGGSRRPMRGQGPVAPPEIISNNGGSRQMSPGNPWAGLMGQQGGY